MMWGTWGSFTELIIVMNHRLFGCCSGLLHEHSLADAASLLNGCVHANTHRTSSRTLTDSSSTSWRSACGAFRPTRHRGQTSEVRTVILEQRHFRGLLRWGCSLQVYCTCDRQQPCSRSGHCQTFEHMSIWAVNCQTHHRRAIPSPFHRLTKRGWERNMTERG